MALFWGFVNKGLNNPQVLWRQHIDFSSIMLRHCDFSIFIYQKNINIALKCCKRHVLWCRPFTKTTCFVTITPLPVIHFPGYHKARRDVIARKTSLLTHCCNCYVLRAGSNESKVQRLTPIFCDSRQFTVESNDKVVIWGHSWSLSSWVQMTGNVVWGSDSCWVWCGQRR